MKGRTLARDDTIHATSTLASSAWTKTGHRNLLVVAGSTMTYSVASGIASLGTAVEPLAAEALHDTRKASASISRA